MASRLFNETVDVGDFLADNPDVSKHHETIEVRGGGQPRAAMAAKLGVGAGGDAGLEGPLQGWVDAGADPSCKLVLHDPAVSRRHLSVTLAANRIVVRDLGSRNGTFLGGTRLKEAEVPLGAVLTLGDSAIAIQSRWYVREVSPSAAR